ncbi:hypothetical protein LINPERPRIM_LOCUS20673 [Linum perenne]
MPRRHCRSAFRSSSASSQGRPLTSANVRGGRLSTGTICCGL